jgi:hypothetical protein
MQEPNAWASEGGWIVGAGRSLPGFPGWREDRAGIVIIRFFGWHAEYDQVHVPADLADRASEFDDAGRGAALGRLGGCSR